MSRDIWELGVGADTDGFSRVRNGQERLQQTSDYVLAMHNKYLVDFVGRNEELGRALGI